MSEKKTRLFQNRTNGYQTVDLNVNGKMIRLFNVHLQSNTVTGLANHVVNRRNFRKRQTWKNLKGMFTRYRHAAGMRTGQAGEIAQAINSSPYPVILAGDLNDVPQSHAYYHLTKTLKDTFKEHGVGWGMTFAGSIPGLRIDYVLIDETFQTHEVSTQQIEFSDHRMVKSTILIR